MGSPPKGHNYTEGGISVFMETNTNKFASWFNDNVKESGIEYSSGIKMHTWEGLPSNIGVEFGTDNRFHFVQEEDGVKSYVTLFDGTGVGTYMRSVIKNGDRISIVYIPDKLLTL